MTTAKKLLSTTQTGGDKLYVDDVFSTYLYAGNGSTQTINNGIDLAGKGGLVWIKDRTVTNGHVLSDTARGGGGKYLQSNTTAPQNTDTTMGVKTFNSSGFTTNKFYVNEIGSNHVAWTFRNAPKFFDVVTYTGDGAASRAIAHGLNCAAGTIIVKQLDGYGTWKVWHRSLASGNLLELNSTSAEQAQGYFPSQPTDSVFYVSATPGTAANALGGTYVAYLWAHDPSEEGLVQCGSFTHSTFSSVSLGWEPQFYLIKRVDVASNWMMFDSMRGVATVGAAGDGILFPNSSGVESFPTSVNVVDFTANGANNVTLDAGTYIYLAIRRPNKPPKTGAEVYNAIATSGTNTNSRKITGYGFSPDALILSNRNTSSYDHWIFDRLRGAKQKMYTDAATAEALYTTNGVSSFDMDGWTQGTSDGAGGWDTSGNTWIFHGFRRAPGFFDVVCYTGTGVARTVNHNLGVAPELMIVKARTSGSQIVDWSTNVSLSGGTVGGNGSLNSTVAFNNLSWTVYPSGNNEIVVHQFLNTSSQNYVAYLFATLPGISKVGYYTGNGTSLSVECGFSTGARFILVKSVDDVGDWFVWDTARGIVAANDPHLSLNTTAVEVTTDDSVDPYTGGFIVNQNTSTNINITGKRYIFLAIA